MGKRIYAIAHASSILCSFLIFYKCTVVYCTIFFYLVSLISLVVILDRASAQNTKGIGMQMNN